MPLKFCIKSKKAPHIVREYEWPNESQRITKMLKLLLQVNELDATELEDPEVSDISAIVEADRKYHASPPPSSPACSAELALFALAQAEERLEDDFSRFVPGEREQGYGEIRLGEDNVSLFLSHYEGVTTKFVDIGSGTGKIPMLVAAVKKVCVSHF